MNLYNIFDFLPDGVNDIITEFDGRELIEKRRKLKYVEDLEAGIIQLNHIEKGMYNCGSHTGHTYYQREPEYTISL